jgi:plasmid stabilization system protein ParE
MRIFWSLAAQTDLDRIHSFLARHDSDAAATVLDALIEAPEALLDFPRRGSRLSEFDPREVREFRVRSYLVRYELGPRGLFVLRLFHVREDRF